MDDCGPWDFAFGNATADGWKSMGFQICWNLPQRLQMTDPGYQDIPSSEITEFEEDGVSYRFIAGELFGQTGPAQTHLPVLMVDIAPHGVRQRFL